MKNIIFLLSLVAFSFTATAQETNQQFSLDHQGFLAFSLF